MLITAANNLVDTATTTFSFAKRAGHKTIQFVAMHPAIDGAFGATAVGTALFCGPGGLSCSMIYVGLRAAAKILFNHRPRVLAIPFVLAPLIGTAATLNAQQHDLFSQWSRASIIENTSASALKAPPKEGESIYTLYTYSTNGLWSWQKTLKHEGMIKIQVVSRSGQCFSVQSYINDPYYFPDSTKRYFGQDSTGKYCQELERPKAYEDAKSILVLHQ